MNLHDVKHCVEVLDLRERVIVKLAIIAGMRPEKSSGLPGGAYRRITSKLSSAYTAARSIHRKPTSPCVRQPCLEVSRPILQCGGNSQRIQRRTLSFFASERKTPLANENVWRRNILPTSRRLGWKNIYTQVPV